MPWRCAALTASVSAIASERKRSIGKPRAGICLLSVSPSTSSIVRKRRPSASSIECSITMPGWLSEATACASRSKRLIFSGCERHLRRQHLERDAPVEARIERQVHLAHAARAEGLEDLVRADAAADQAAIWLHLTHDRSL